MLCPCAPASMVICSSSMHLYSETRQGQEQRGQKSLLCLRARWKVSRGREISAEALLEAMCPASPGLVGQSHKEVRNKA